MRKDVSYNLRMKQAKNKVILLLLAILLFVVANGFLVYYTNINNPYLSFIKKVVPFPAFVVGDRVVTVAEYEKSLLLSRKIYENSYKIDFTDPNYASAYDQLVDKTKEEVVDRVVMEEVLDGIGISVTKKDVNNEYDLITGDISSGKEISETIRFVSGLSGGDLKEKIYEKLLADNIKENIVRNIKLELIAISSSDLNRGEVHNVHDNIVNGGTPFSFYKNLYSKEGDFWSKTIDGVYLLPAELPNVFYDSVKELPIGGISDVVDLDSYFYIFRLNSEIGYFDGSVADFISQQRDNIRIWSFVH